MIAPRWKKVLRDLWGNKLRTTLVVLSIAVGVFAVGTVTHTFTIVSQELALTYPQANPAAATIYTDAFDDALVEMVRRVPGVADAEARSMLYTQILIGDEKKMFLIFALPDFNDIRINKVRFQNEYRAAPEFHAETGHWPPGEREIVLERSSLLMPGLVPSDLQVGDTIQVQIGEKLIRELKIVGLAHETTQAPAPFMSAAFGYVNLDTYEWLTGSRRASTLNLTVAERKLDQEHIKAVVETVKQKIEADGRTVSVNVPQPGKHPLQDIFAGLLLLLNLLGFGSLILSGFLVVNTISALLTQQTRQIGMMKAIGGRKRQIIGLYLVMVLLFGLLALLVAIPSAAFAASKLSLYLAGFVNVDFPDFSVPTWIILLESAIGLLLPLCAAILPIWAGTRVTVREALSDYGIQNAKVKIQNSKPGWLRQRLPRLRPPNLEAHILRFVSRPTLISLRNTFRRKGRLALTLMTLILAGTIFVSVVSVRASMFQTLDDVFKYWQFDILLPLARPYRTDVIEATIKNVPGVVAVESWGYGNVRRIRPDDTETDTMLLFAPPPNTQMLFPTIIEGRWLSPEDENAIVVSTDTLNAEKDLKVGGEITLKIREHKTVWRIVGSVRVVGFRSGIGTGYVNYPHYARAIGQLGRADSVQIVTDKHATAEQEKIRRQIEAVYKDAGIRVGGGAMTSGFMRDNNEMFFNIITALLMAMAVLMAAVGGLGLMGTMSLNVLERTREIGVMRAIGASNAAVRNIVLVEGVFIGMLSATLAIALSIPLGAALAALVGEAIFQLPLSYAISVFGIIMWLVIVLVLSALASVLPAYNAARLTVREILAYE